MGNTYYNWLYCGDVIPKVYKSSNKLVVSIPYDVVSSLGIKDGDDLDFLKYGDNTFLVVKKNDIVKMLAKVDSEVREAKSGKSYTPRSAAGAGIALEEDELAVLKKLDTLKYNDRTGSKVASMLNSSEKATLQGLLKRSIIVPFRKSGEKDVKYSIQKRVYDTFLYRKNMRGGGVVMQPQPQQMQKVRVQQKSWEQKISGTESYVDMLESKGYLVLGNEAEASMVSASLEESIRDGLVLGTRAFNKKFYIGLRGFINKYTPKILKVIDQKSVNVEDIAKEVGIEEDGARTILYVLSESGDVTEVRRDIFRAA